MSFFKKAIVKRLWPFFINFRIAVTFLNVKTSYVIVFFKRFWCFNKEGEISLFY